MATNPPKLGTTASAPATASAKKPAVPLPGSPGAAKAATAAAAKPTGPTFKVRAIADGYIYNVYRRVDDVFLVTEADFSATWMERVAANTPEKVTGAGQAGLNAEHERLRREASGVEAASVGADHPTGALNPLGDD